MNRLLVGALILYCYVAQAQSFMRPSEWKKYKREVFVHVGSANFLGDLGGRDRIGTDYSPADLDFSQTRTAFSIGGRYKLDRVVNVVAKMSYLAVRGDDAMTEEPIRNNRNLNFKSPIYELSGRIEGGYQSTRRGGNRYGIVQNYGKARNFTHNVFAFIGVGAFYFEPKGRTAQGDWVKLRPLRTEGQGLPGGPKPYKPFSVCVPIGGYYKLTINKVWSVGLEFCYRKTFTDYIDDVGTVYYDKNALSEAYGTLSAQMSDPNKGLIYGATSPATDGTPAQRGDLQKDAFMSLELTASYIFKKQRRSARLRSKF